MRTWQGWFRSIPALPPNMKKYQIVAASGEILATLTCDGMRFDLEHPEDHVIPQGDVIAATITLGEGFTMEECGPRT
jgi:hypothetical protein